MKKTITILFVVISSCNLGFGQKDTTQPKPIADSIPILSVNDINRYLQPLETQLTVDKYKDFLNIIQYMIATKQKELSTPKKK